MADISFTPEAIEDLQGIKSYITNDLCNEQAALNFISDIMKGIRRLSDFPEMGTTLSSVIDLQVPYRYIICGNYTVFYKIEHDKVYIIRVLYGRRNFMQILFGE